MIEKMKFLSITGPKADIDRVVDTYLSRYEIHLENALSELKTVKDLRPYIETNPYKEKFEYCQRTGRKDRRTAARGFRDGTSYTGRSSKDGR